jgi:hypothetical protein
MESSHLDPQPNPPDDPLEVLLRVPAPALRDDGFAARVLASLPPVRSRAARRSHVEWCSLAALVGTLGTLALPAPWQEISKTWALALEPLWPAFEPFANSLALATLVLAASIAYALRPHPRRRTAQ